MFKFIYLLIIPFILFLSCSEDDSTEPTKTYDAKLLHSDYVKLWKISDWVLNGQKVTDASMLDEVLIFNKLGGGIIAYGENDNSPADTLTTDYFKYEIISNNILRLTELHPLHSTEGTLDYKILDLTDSKLVLEFSGTINEQQITSKITYEKTVIENPNASVENLALTRGNVKLWKVATTIVNGLEENNPCHRDDIFLYATDGTAIKLSGDRHCVAGDITNNDFFSWELISNGNKMIRKEMHASWNHQGGGKLSIPDTVSVTKLSSDEFEYEVKNTLDGVPRTVKITFVPFIR